MQKKQEVRIIDEILNAPDVKNNKADLSSDDEDHQDSIMVQEMRRLSAQAKAD